MLRGFVFICFLTCFSSYAETLKVAAIEWPPFSGKDLPKNGLSVAITMKALETAGYQVNFKFVPWERSLQGVEEGLYHVLPAVWINEERKEYMFFSKPYAANELVVVSPAAKKLSFEGYDSLKGKNAGLVRGYSYPKALLDADFIPKSYVGKVEQNLKKLARGRVDFTIGDKIVLSYTAKKSLGSMAKNLHFDSTPIEKKDLFMTVSKRTPNAKTVIENINKALEQLEASGELDNLIKEFGI
ncbi:substrate-binding periplasmic protein [Algicola sagamiensis]|uniref:substrate-binding periplasmic protein n=1 Tax=Algicola sagamiensis TaxID=163869 RepID=UPI0003765D17|nr:transporter substrate-binding domain-containing protein [Algicola sagamiensis]